MSGNNQPKNKWGNPIHIKPGESWFNIMEEEERKAAAREEERRRAEAAAAEVAAAKRRAQQEQSRLAALRRETNQMREQLRKLNALAEAAPANVVNPQIGNFKKAANGQLYRWAHLQVQGGPGYRRQRPQWYKVARHTNYEPDLQVYLNRVRRLGANYQTRRRNRRNSRKTRRRS
jgi:chromosome segregation ATPase